jgi:predicted PurR-regulated permease PerM
MLHMPVDVRNLSLAMLALFASVALLHWASAVFIPIMLSLLLTTALRPLVEAVPLPRAALAQCLAHCSSAWRWGWPAPRGR